MTPPTSGRTFPIQSDTTKERPFENLPSSTVPWWLAEVAWSVYESKYGESQTMERMAERGGCRIARSDCETR